MIDRVTLKGEIYHYQTVNISEGIFKTENSKHIAIKITDMDGAIPFYEKVNCSDHFQITIRSLETHLSFKYDGQMMACV